MASPRIDEQVKNLLRMIREGKYGAESLLNLFDNVDKQKDDDKITEEQHEELVEAIEIQLWAVNASKAKKLFGARNRDTHKKLQVFLDDLLTRHDLSENQHKTKVKVGGNVLRGEAILYDYISYKNRETGMLAHLAFRRIKEKDKLELDVRKVHFREQETGPKPTVFEPHNFDDSCELFEEYLSEVLAGL